MALGAGADHLGMVASSRGGGWRTAMRGWRSIRILCRCSNARVGPLRAPLLLAAWRTIMGLGRRPLGRWRSRHSYAHAAAHHGVAREEAQLLAREPVE